MRCGGSGEGQSAGAGSEELEDAGVAEAGPLSGGGSAECLRRAASQR